MESDFVNISFKLSLISIILLVFSFLTAYVFPSLFLVGIFIFFIILPMLILATFIWSIIEIIKRKNREDLWGAISAIIISIILILIIVFFSSAFSWASF